MKPMRIAFVIVAVLACRRALLPSVFADAKGDEILRAAFKKLHEAKTMTFDLVTETKISQLPDPLSWKGKVAAMKPNYLKVAMAGEGAPSFVADGKDYYISAGGQSAKMPLEKMPLEMQGIWEGELDAFYGGEKLVEKVTTMYAGAEKIEELDCDLVKVDMKMPDRVVVYAIGRTDRLIHRAVLIVTGPNGQTVTQTNTLSNIKFNVEKTAADFEFKP